MHLRALAGIAIAGAALLPPALAVAAGTTSRANGAATAEVMDPISVRHVGGQELKFGSFTVTKAGTITVPTSGGATVTGGVTRLGGAGTATDKFVVRGIRNRAVSIVTYPGTVSSGTRSMQFTTTPSVTTATLSNGGQLNFTVGGTLNVPAGQASGTYAGTYLVGVIYN